MFNTLHQYPPFQQTLNAISAKELVALMDMTEAQRAFFACAIQRVTGRPVLYVAPGLSAAERMMQDLSAFSGERCALLLPDDIRFLSGARSRETLWRNLEAAYRIFQKQADILVVTPEALMQRFPAAAPLAAMQLALTPGAVCDLGDLAERLTAWGYDRVDMVEGKGQFAIRGDLADIFPPTAPEPLRIEFFDNEVDQIRTFDLLSQRSDRLVDACVLTCADPYKLAPDQAAHAAQTMKDLIDRAKRRQHAGAVTKTLTEEEDGAAPLSLSRQMGYERLSEEAEGLAQTHALSNATAWAPVLPYGTVNLESWLPDAVVVIDTPAQVFQRLDDRMEGFLNELSGALLRAEAVPEQENIYDTPAAVKARLAALPLVFVQDLLRTTGGLAPKHVLSMKGLSASKYQGRLKMLADDVKASIATEQAFLLLTSGEAACQRLRDALMEMDCPVPIALNPPKILTPGAPVIAPLPITGGFLWTDAQLFVITDTDVFGKSQKKSRQSKQRKAKLDSFVDIKMGDYVVHDQHGIGIYQGTVRIQTEGTWRDYMLIQYKGTDKLYIPTDQFDRVQKYIGSQGDAPPLNSLSSNQWEKQKAKVKASLKKLAFNLVNLYAQRMNTPGYAFPPQSAWERQFDDQFDWDLTPDQQAAVRDVMHDMERPVNMDRIICGDVGYGKTEVAMRAAFRAVMGGKQVAVLAPTTILAHQHYATFKKRFAGFPVEIGVISRFSTPKENKDTLFKMNHGNMDILIGTHRLLSKDVKYRNLGLLIIDEEQRFGVGHKESIKELKKTVDVLTLSATPIPRTLHMGMVGVRDMSLLETPPERRHPVQSYVVDYHDGLVRDAILREINRKGQIYFLYNQVRSIEAFAQRLRALVPEARVMVAHGQMRDNALEDIMEDFSSGNADVLVASTIIENGIDIPNANTLIVFDADRFGLSQLYQLRGRVGRADKAAYAYFMVQKDKALSEDAQKRLAAIKEFTEFGAGFRIAMRDLEIRGAGNIFGPEQSGQVSVIGYDMYCKMIEEAVREAQGDFTFSKENQREARVEFNIDAFLPESYIAGQNQRVEIYKRISTLKTEEDRLTLIDDLIDRFAEPPESVMNLMDIATLRALCIRIGADLATYQSGYVSLRLNAGYVERPEALVAALPQDKSIILTGGSRPALLIKTPKEDESAALRHCLTPLKHFADRMETAAQTLAQEIQAPPVNEAR